jgi:hypothetical protein
MDKKTPSKNLPEMVKKSNKYDSSETSRDFNANEPTNEKNCSSSGNSSGANNANNANNAKYRPNYNK